MKFREGAPQTLPEEEKENLEMPPERERASIFRWLRERGFLIYMAATLSAGAPFKHEKLEAAEIPKAASWSEGVKILQKGVTADEVETAATFYLDTKGQRQKWLFSKEGEKTRVAFKPSEIHLAAEQELATSASESILLCQLHTHPLGAAEGESDWISSQQRRDIQGGKYSLSIPPSGYLEGHGDINNMARSEIVLQTMRGQAETDVTAEMRYGVVDHAGITYYRPITDEDLKKEFPSVLAELKQRQVTAAEWEKTISLTIHKADSVTIDRLHSLLPDKRDYNSSDYKKFTAAQISGFKRQDIFWALAAGGVATRVIAQEFITGNQQAQKTHDDFVRFVREPMGLDMSKLDDARSRWIHGSMVIKPEELPISSLYPPLREAFARNGAHIRFVPHQNIPDEPPCAGTDYKQ